MKSLSIFLKGIAMGIVEVIPGISGGTIALVTGIYDRLILGLKNLNVQWVYFYLVFLFTRNALHKRKANAYWKKIDFGLFIPLIIGMALAVYSSSFLITYLLTHYERATLAFFVGLVLASIFLVFEDTPKKHHANLYGILGLLIGAGLAFLLPQSITPTYGIMLISGFIGVSVMLIPGISGSYVLLVLGQYYFVQSAIKNFSR